MRLLVIGGGPGGYVAAIRGAQLGAEVVLVERQALGGTCLNVGCIPTKALLHTAELYRMSKESAQYGVIADPYLDFPKAQEHKNKVVKKLVGGVNSLMKANRVEVIRASATFTGKNSVQAGDRHIVFDRAIIATGSTSVLPPIPGMDVPQCIDSTGALEMEQVPESMVIIGGGVIGVEMASVYAALGCKTIIVEMLEEIVPMIDREFAQFLRAGLQKQGVTIMTNTKVLSIRDNGEYAVVQVESDGIKEEIDAVKVLISVGRKANTDALDLESAGVNHKRGQISVDGMQRTNVPGIYAIGDCTGGLMLAHVASAQGEVAAENAMGHNAVFSGKTTPSCVYTNPEYAGTGITEEQAKAQGLDYVVGRFPLAANGKSMIMGGEGIVKIIAGKEFGEVLGMHIVGPRATDLIAEGALAIAAEATLDEIVSTIHAHPTVAEAIREAALAAKGRAIHI